MNLLKPSLNRRNFLRDSAAMTAGAVGLGCFTTPSQASAPADNRSEFFIGPMEGYSPQIGTLVSMLNYNRASVIDVVKDLSQKDLDYLQDPKANSIGALIMHLGATEKFYQGNTFEGRQELSDADKKVWGSAWELEDAGRRDIKGKEVQYYIDMITAVRQKTLEEFKKKDDAWLLAVDPIWSKQRNMDFNTYWKWFHVCEHESHHRGQMSWLKGRLPGAKTAKE